MFPVPPLEVRRWLDALPQLVWLLSPDGAFRWGNRAWRTLTAQGEADAPSGVRTPVSPEDGARLQQLVSGASTLALDLPLRAADGEAHWFHLDGTRDADGWVITGSSIDALRDEQHERRTLQGVIDASPNCIKVLDLDGRLLDMNAGGRVTMEIDDFESCRDLPWPSFWAGEARTLVEAALARARAGETSTFEAPTTTYKGSPRVWEVSVAPLYDAQGHVHRLSAVSRDVTARREAQDAVVALDAFVAFSEAVGTETDLLALVRQAVRVARSSLAQVSVAYYERADDRWVARVWSDDLAPDVVTQLRAGVPLNAPHASRAARSGEPLFVDGRDAAGEPLPGAAPCGAVALLPLGPAGAVRGLFTLGTRDARAWTEREQATLRALGRGLGLAAERAEAMQYLAAERSKLQAANEELEAFAYSVSHDLRTPVRHIASFSNLLRKSLADRLDEKSGRHLGVIEAGAERMNKLIDALLDLSRMSRLPLRLGVVDLGVLVDRARDELLPELANRAVQWDVQPLPLVMGDHDTLQQVLTNLLSNAVKYTRNEDVARVRVWAEDRERVWAVFVQDNGAGFDARYAGKLFGVFQRLHRHEEFEGTGVGLANVRRIVHRHGGEVSAQGELGAGATFGFTLPKTV